MRRWTPEERQKQAEVARRHRPWEKSTGPRTARGKYRSSKYAYVHGFRSQAYRDIRALLRWQMRVMKDILAPEPQRLYSTEAEGKGMTQEPPHVDPVQAREWTEKGEAIIIDVREKDEFRTEHIPGAVSHPVSALNTGEIARIAGGRKIIFHCGKGGRAGKACEAYLGNAASGGGNIYLLEGSFTGWKAAGLPTEKESGAISLERQVLIAAGSLILLGVLLSIFAMPGFVWLSGLVGAGMIYAGASGNCMMKKLLMTLPFNRESHEQR